MYEHDRWSQPYCGLATGEEGGGLGRAGEGDSLPTGAAYIPARMAPSCGT